MDLTAELMIMTTVLDKIPGEKLDAFHDRQMCKHYDAIYKEVKNAPERLKLEQTSLGDFYARGVELLTKAKALRAFLESAQGK